ncbi:hypothetical protein [Oscillibacter ruminantium]|uniref:hypothetical protein n=1 Tax=Oscillibacter ruminantium TaxID=1263547 RepID=UPI00331A0F7A
MSVMLFTSLTENRIPHRQWDFSTFLAQLRQAGGKNYAKPLLIAAAVYGLYNKNSASFSA